MIHPSFIRAAALTSKNLRDHFPKSSIEAMRWRPELFIRALDRCVIVVAETRVECAWAAYCGAVPGHDHKQEVQEVIHHGTKLDERLARTLFPLFDEVPYAH